MSVEIRPPRNLEALARELKDAPKEIRREMAKALGEATGPFKEAFRESARTTLPNSGGLAEKVAKSRIYARRYSNRNRGGVKIVTSNRYGLAQIDKGQVRHPLFGNREVWVTQQVTPGVWSNPRDQVGPQTRRDVEKAMQRVANKIERA